jgi:hypothetical protein
MTDLTASSLSVNAAGSDEEVSDPSDSVHTLCSVRKAPLVSEINRDLPFLHHVEPALIP